MEYVSGPTLRQLLDESPGGPGHAEGRVLPPRDRQGAHATCTTAASSTATSSPANIFYENGYVKIGDYGLSKAHRADASTAARRSPSARCTTWPRRSARASTTAAIDIYALGARAVRDAHRHGRRSSARAPSEILMKHLSAEPDVQRHRRAVRDASSSKAMAKDPAQRYQTRAGDGRGGVRRRARAAERVGVLAGRVVGRRGVRGDSACRLRRGRRRRQRCGSVVLAVVVSTPAAAAVRGRRAAHRRRAGPLRRPPRRAGRSHGRPGRSRGRRGGSRRWKASPRGRWRSRRRSTTRGSRSRCNDPTTRGQRRIIALIVAVAAGIFAASSNDDRRRRRRSQSSCSPSLASLGGAFGIRLAVRRLTPQMKTESEADPPHRRWRARGAVRRRTLVPVLGGQRGAVRALDRDLRPAVLSWTPPPGPRPTAAARLVLGHRVPRRAVRVHPECRVQSRLACPGGDDDGDLPDHADPRPVGPPAAAAAAARVEDSWSRSRRLGAGGRRSPASAIAARDAH